MSGEVDLGSGPRIAALVAALSALAERVPASEFAVIGGLAVLAHLGGAHRVTDDLDTVATQHGDTPSAVEFLVSEMGTSGGILGTKVDAIAVGDIPAAALPSSDLPTDEFDRAFVLAHRWGLDDAQELAVVASDPATGTRVQARCRFASPASIIAMKLQAAPRRRAARAHKAGGDYFDIFLLLAHPSLTSLIATSMRHAPHDLGTWSADRIRIGMVDGADRTAALIARSGVAGPAAPSPAELARAGRMVLEHYGRDA